MKRTSQYAVIHRNPVLAVSKLMVGFLRCRRVPACHALFLFSQQSSLDAVLQMKAFM